MEAFDLAIGLRATWPGLLHDGPGLGTGLRPTALVARAVVGDDAFTDNALRSEPGDRSMPERGGGVAGFVVVDLGVHEAGAVIECRVDEPVASSAVAAAATVEPPAAAVGDPTDLLHIDVDELTRPVALIAADRFDVGGPVSAIEPAAARGVQDPLHRRRRQARFVGQAVRAPTMLVTQPHDPFAGPRRRRVRGPVRP